MFKFKSPLTSFDCVIPGKYGIILISLKEGNYSKYNRGSQRSRPYCFAVKRGEHFEFFGDNRDY